MVECFLMKENCKNINVKCFILIINRYEVFLFYIEELDINLFCEILEDV